MGGSSKDKSGESELRGTLGDKRNPDTVLHVDDEEDTLYEDGLEVEDGSQPQSGVDGKDDNAR